MNHLVFDFVLNDIVMFIVRPKMDSLEDPNLHVSEYKRLCGDIWNTMWIEQGINIGRCGVILHLVRIENEEELTLYPLQARDCSLFDR